MKKYYFSDSESDTAYKLDYHLSNAKDEGLSEVELFEAVPEKVKGFFFCNAYGEVGEDGCCSMLCEGYNPRNGRSGMCKMRSNTFYEHGKRVIFKVK